MNPTPLPNGTTLTRAGVVWTITATNGAVYLLARTVGSQTLRSSCRCSQAAGFAPQPPASPPTAP